MATQKHDIEYSTNRIFMYNITRKKMIGLTLVLGTIFMTTLISGYIYYLKISDSIALELLGGIMKHVMTNVKSGTGLGIFYSAAVGGLFFIFMPMEVLFYGFLKSGAKPLILIGVYIFGIFLAYSVNYFLGSNMATISKKLIGQKKFFKIKGLINRHGAIVIFLFNATPLPSQVLSAILGVFHYNRTRFYMAFLSGQILKYSVMIGVYLYMTKTLVAGA